MARRAPDFVARFGGEEFALILPGTDPLQAAELAESARLRVERLGIRHPSLRDGASVTISLGIASAIGGLFPSAEALVEAADTALYAAKRQGRNKAVSSTSGPDCPDGSASPRLVSVAGTRKPAASLCGEQLLRLLRGAADEVELVENGLPR